MKHYENPFNTDHDIFSVMRKEAREHIRGRLEEYEGYLCDFHNYAFNTWSYTDFEEEAVSAINDNGGFKAIAYIVNYEKSNFGEVNTDFSNGVNVVNMLWYIIGEEEIYCVFDGCDEYDQLWNEEITEEESKMLITWAKENGRL